MDSTLANKTWTILKYKYNNLEKKGSPNQCKPFLEYFVCKIINFNYSNFIYNSRNAFLNFALNSAGLYKFLKSNESEFHIVWLRTKIRLT